MKISVTLLQQWLYLDMKECLHIYTSRRGTCNNVNENGMSEWTCAYISIHIDYVTCTNE